MWVLAPEKHTTSDFTSQISDNLGFANRVATGSFGDVYRCTIQLSTVVIGETEAAVKVFRIDPTSRNMDNLAKALVRELKVSLRLKHPNIVPLFGIARVESPLPAFVSQWMSSGTLSEYLDRHGATITSSTRIELVDGIANGLSYLHSEKVVHGDLHPGNVFIDDSGGPCLTDFGFAAIAEHPELQWTTATARHLVSRWCAPEVLGVNGDPRGSDFKSDIYSFGSIALFVLSGDIPWKEKKHSSQIFIELSKKATPVQLHDISLDYRNMIKQCWSWEPGHRPEAIIVLNWVRAMKEHPLDTTINFTFEVYGKIGSLIATGSFGNVYSCSTTVESRIGRTEVALKVFKVDPSSTTEALSKAIFRALKMWLKLKHPNVVPLLGIAMVESPLPALVSQWMPSGTLSEYLEKRGNAITPSARYGLVKGIADGLAYLHSEDVIHGDLHPGNVLIDSSGDPCLTDFGLATVAEEPDLQWNTMAIERTLDSRWSSPEVLGIDCDPERPTFKSDIYSFGSVMFFIVSGDVPWMEKKYSYQICMELSKRATPARPRDIGDYHWDLIQTCWFWAPRDRPKAARILEVIAEQQLKTTSTVAHHRDTTTDPPSVVTESLTSHVPRTKNIVLFGETEAARSSVVNLMAGQQMATMSSDMEDCTLHWQDHAISFDGHSFNVFDTLGLDSQQLRMKEYLDAIGHAHGLVEKLDNEGGIDLLVLCMRVETAITITTTLQTNYRLFFEWLCDRKVPIILVLTGLEVERRMESWWVRNKYVFPQSGINVAGHACIPAAATSKMDGRHRKLHEESRRLVRELVIKHVGREGAAYKGGEESYGRITQKLWELTQGQVRSTPKKKDIEDVFVNHCGMSPVVVKELAVTISSSLESPGRQK